jgi:hypothetical protein
VKQFRPKRVAAFALIIVFVVIVGCSYESEKGAAVTTPKPVVFDHQHLGLAKVLTKVSDRFGMVDYGLLKNDPAELEAYLNLVATVPHSQFDGWTRPRRMAFLLNVYNATTLKLLAGHHPVVSIKEIGGLRSVWHLKVARLFGEKISLKFLEDELIRKQFKSPAVHFALVCGSRGCPLLRSEPYTADKLEVQFTEQAREFLHDPIKNYVDLESKTVFLSPIFSWFEDDFGKTDAEVIALVARHFKAFESEALTKGGFTIKYTQFDWRVNQSPPSEK